MELPARPSSILSACRVHSLCSTMHCRRAGGDLIGDQQTAEIGDVGGDGFRGGVWEEGKVVVCHEDLLLEVVMGRPARHPQRAGQPRPPGIQ